ncbi:membrane-bound serine protease (ClpP class) [Bacillus mesophilus]|uniref:Nodulation protein NfeD n=1 Tax=Bacillus mesophilus TaxID=1808955 RepID=A0A6M0Q5W1_9BACI|nr:nodulation protein NfeD [Bacillus mesophilus]MBM7660789.1 membrane-bound serine protease (ClpP class) [Bacillus mesophilus]NEY71664.1 nodulation protein NfeD [Bacillus mesophilus]
MKIKNFVWLVFSILLISVIIGNFGSNAVASDEEKVVYVIPVQETVEKGLLAFINRSIKEAEEMNAELIILDINTPGGVVAAASDIAKSVTSTNVPLIAFVNKQALSAGAYIALNADEIYMTPGSTMGSAAIIDQQGNAAGAKAESFWLAAMKSAAELNDRDPIYALAMADQDIDLPELGAGKGELLTLTPTQAVEVGYSEGTVSSLSELTEKLGVSDHQIVQSEVSLSENIARFITHPVVVPILLSLGSLGLILELYSPGFGIPGFVGVSSLLLFFYGHTVAGLAGMEAIILFVVGFILLIIELFVPGGILGVIGLAAVLTSVFISTESIELAAISVFIAFLVCVIVSVLLFKVFGKKIRLFDRLVLKDATHTEQGYVSNVNRHELVGLEGETVSPLRPSGTAIFNDEYLHVVTEGVYISEKTPVKIVKVEGARVVVREIRLLEE